MLQSQLQQEFVYTQCWTAALHKQKS